MTLANVRNGAFLRGLFFLLLIALSLTGCTGGRQAVAKVTESAEAPVDSLKVWVETLK